MEISKLTIDKRWLHQESKQRMMLNWIEKHSNICRNTTISGIVHAMILDKDFDLGLTEGSANQVFYALMRRGLVEKIGLPHKQRATFKLNYYHPELPPDLKACCVEPNLETTVARTQEQLSEITPQPQPILDDNSDEEYYLEIITKKGTEVKLSVKTINEVEKLINIL